MISILPTIATISCMAAFNSEEISRPLQVILIILPLCMWETVWRTCYKQPDQSAADDTEHMVKLVQTRVGGSNSATLTWFIIRRR